MSKFTKEQVTAAMEAGATLICKKGFRFWMQDGYIFFTNPDSPMLHESSYNTEGWARFNSDRVESFDYTKVTHELLAKHLAD